MPPLILASGSIHRKRLFERLGLAFRCVEPGIDESARPGESPRELVLRLSREKAGAVAALHPDALVIGSDQLGSCDGRILGKPGTEARAREQLLGLAGREAEFLTGLCVLDARTMRELASVERCVVRLRPLDAAAIHEYVRREQPLDCAGSFRVEGLGIALFESIRLDDPTVLEGLPLIRLTGFLEQLGIPVLGRQDDGRRTPHPPG